MLLKSSMNLSNHHFKKHYLVLNLIFLYIFLLFSPSVKKNLTNKECIIFTTSEICMFFCGRIFFKKWQA